jgi:hypothetical protein
MEARPVRAAEPTLGVRAPADRGGAKVMDRTAPRGESLAVCAGAAAKELVTAWAEHRRAMAAVPAVFLERLGQSGHSPIFV